MLLSAVTGAGTVVKAPSTSSCRGYIGDAKSLIVVRRVGFLPVEGHPYLHVIPMSLSQAALAPLTERVKALGPF